MTGGTAAPRSRRRAAPALLGVLLVGGCTGSPAAVPSSGQAARESVVSGAGPVRFSDLRLGADAAALAVPADDNGAVVLFVHGAGQDARSVFDDPDDAPLSDALLSAGYVVASSDAGGDAWGTAASVSAYEALWREVRRRTGATEVFLLAESMGGLPALELADRVPVTAVAALYPVCDLASVYRVPGLRQQIDAAHGSETGAALARLSPVAVPAGVSMLIWASADDEVVPKEQNADVCAAEARRGGGEAVVVTTQGPHGDPSNFDPGRLLDFFADER